MVQKAIAYVTHEHLIDKKSLSGCHSMEVKEFQPCGNGVFFPKRTEYRKQIGVEQISADPSDCLTFVATKLSVNSPLAGDPFDFRFPAGLEVGERDKNNRMGEGEKVYIWGADNKPAQTFASERDYLMLQYARHFEEMRAKGGEESRLEEAEGSGGTGRILHEHAQVRRGHRRLFTVDRRRPDAARKGERGVPPRHGVSPQTGLRAKRLSISTKRCVSRTSPATKRACVFTGRLAYAGQDGTLDKAMNDLAKIEDISPEGPDDFNCCWASLLRGGSHPSPSRRRGQRQSPSAERRCNDHQRHSTSDEHLAKPRGRCADGLFFRQGQIEQRSRLCGVASRGGETPAEERVSA